MNDLAICVHSPKIKKWKTFESPSLKELPPMLPKRASTLTRTSGFASELLKLPKLSFSASAQTLSRSTKSGEDRSAPLQAKTWSHPTVQKVAHYVTVRKALIIPEASTWNPEKNTPKYRQTFSVIHHDMKKNQKQQRGILQERVRIRMLENSERIRGSCNVLHYFTDLPESSGADQPSAEGDSDKAAQIVVRLTRHSSNDPPSELESRLSRHSSSDLKLESRLSASHDLKRESRRPGSIADSSQNIDLCPVPHKTPDHLAEGHGRADPHKLRESKNIGARVTSGHSDAVGGWSSGGDFSAHGHGHGHGTSPHAHGHGHEHGSGCESGCGVLSWGLQYTKMHTNHGHEHAHHGHGHAQHGHAQHGHGHAHHGHEHAHDPGCEDAEEAEHLKKSLRWESSFVKFQVDGEISEDELLKALVHSGEEYPNEAWVAEILPCIEPDLRENFLDRRQFFEFLRTYEERKSKFLEEAFDKYCTQCGDGDNTTISLDQVEQVILDAGITVLNDILDEVIKEVDVNGSGKLEFQDFELLMKVLHERRGFLKSEVAELQAAFQKFDRVEQHEIKSQQLVKLCRWLGFVVSERDNKRIQQVDVDHSGTFSFAEFLEFMRVKREEQISFTQQLLQEYPTASDLPGFLQEFGYCLMPGFPMKLAQEVGLQLNGPLSLSDAWRVLRSVRKNEGFLRDEIAELEGIFKYVDKDRCGEVDAMELGGALRKVLGFSMTLDAQQDLVACIDVDDTGKLDFREFLKLFRMFRERELAEVQRVFRKVGVNGKQSPDVLYTVLYRLGYVPAPGMIKPLLKGEKQEQDMGGILKLLHKFRAVECNRIEQQSGFNDSDVQKLRSVFMQYVHNSEGFVGGKDLRDLVEEVVPAAVHDSKVHDRISQVLGHAGHDKDGHINFQQFLFLVRGEEDIRRGEMLKKEKDYARESGYVRAEVKELRIIFQQRAENTGLKATLSKIGCFHLIRDIVRHEDFNKNHGVLMNHFANADRDQDGGLDFPEFLLLMKSLQDTDFLNINDFSLAGRNSQNYGEVVQMDFHGK